MADDKTLIITNGSVAAALLKINKAADSYLTWDDILHEGPVPLCDSLAELTEVRNRYLNQRFALASDDQVDMLAIRNAVVAEHDRFGRIELWFEHDLYDQLQLIQILDHFAGAGLPDGKLILIQADDYLGHQTPENIMRFRDLAAPVSSTQLTTATAAWTAFRQATPEAWTQLLDDDLACLPWLKPAVLRMLQELPSAANGLTRLEAEFMRRFAGKDWAVRKCVGMYLGTQPDPAFVGDWTLFNLLNDFQRFQDPLIEPLQGRFAPTDDAERASFDQSVVKLTPFAEDLLAGKADQIAVNGIDRWWGGTHLTTDRCWRWDTPAHALIAP